MLTTKQQKVLEVITDFISKHGESPTLEELQKILNIKNKRSIAQFLEYLDQKGFINKGRGYRSIRLGDRIIGSQLAIPIPILGVANAGKPLSYAEEKDQGYLHISKNLIKGDTKKYFCLKVEGNSMNIFCIDNKYIHDNSTVLVDSSQKWQEGSNDAYLCIVNGFATIKKVKKEGEYLYLIPESDDPKNQPIILTEDDSVEINGKVINVFNFN